MNEDQVTELARSYYSPLFSIIIMVVTIVLIVTLYIIAGLCISAENKTKGLAKSVKTKKAAGAV